MNTAARMVSLFWLGRWFLVQTPDEAVQDIVEIEEEIRAIKESLNG